MQTIQQQLQSAINAALPAVLQDADTPSISRDALQVVPCANPQFGDYQFNGALPLAKTLKTNPLAIAQNIVENLAVDEISEAPEIVKPGFINFRLKREFIEGMTAAVLTDPRLGVPQAGSPRCVLVDFSAPNVAKPMHVGHIRSTIIGDAIARLLRFSGHNVITDNHIGDWGTQFGKLIVGWKKYEKDPDFEEQLQRDPIELMERLYKQVNAQTEADAKIADDARNETYMLQSGGHKEELTESQFKQFVQQMAARQYNQLQRGGNQEVHIWARMTELSQQQFEEIYGRLGVSFDHSIGESFYNPFLLPVVDDLKQKGIAEESQGAVIIKFSQPEHLVDKPMIIQKSDGAANYATTDLATLQYRRKRWNPDEIVYVVDMRQSLHFQQLFEAARLWGFEDVILKHISFGTILGEDGRPIKTRSGESIKLRDLLDEAEQRALAIVREKNPDLSEEQQREIARVIGIGAVKYADLSQNRTSDYVFSWDKMLAMQGNTAVYLEYAYVRIRSIFRRAEEEIKVAEAKPEMHLEHPAEVELAKFLLRFNLAIETALNDYRINAITDYLFELAQTFTAFYDACPVLKSAEPLRSSRLALCRLTADVLRQGLNLLGIETIEQM